MYHDRAPTVRPSTAEPRKYGRNNLKTLQRCGVM